MLAFVKIWLIITAIRGRRSFVELALKTVSACVRLSMDVGRLGQLWRFWAIGREIHPIELILRICCRRLNKRMHGRFHFDGYAR
jgi:hypothetical protein